LALAGSLDITPGMNSTEDRIWSGFQQGAQPPSVLQARPELPDSTAREKILEPGQAASLIWLMPTPVAR
jgi:hypothetical protein